MPYQRQDFKNDISDIVGNPQQRVSLLEALFLRLKNEDAQNLKHMFATIADDYHQTDQHFHAGFTLAIAGAIAESAHRTDLYNRFMRNAQDAFLRGDPELHFNLLNIHADLMEVLELTRKPDPDYTANLESLSRSIKACESEIRKKVKDQSEPLLGELSKTANQIFVLKADVCVRKQQLYYPTLASQINQFINLVININFPLSLTPPDPMTKAPPQSSMPNESLSDYMHRTPICRYQDERLKLFLQHHGFRSQSPSQYTDFENEPDTSQVAQLKAAPTFFIQDGNDSDDDLDLPPYDRNQSSTPAPQ